MPVAYKIDPELGLIYYMGEGTCTLLEFLQAEEATSIHPLRLPKMKIIMDAFYVELDVDMKNIADVISMNKRRMSRGAELEPTAIISRSKFASVAGEMFGILGEGLPLKFRIFTVLEDAIQWLELAGHREQIFAIQQELQKVLRNAPNGNASPA